MTDVQICNLQGYKHKKAFIIAEGPLESTVRNFWKMIYDRKCAVVVMVSGLVEEGLEASAQYWPDQGGLYQYGEYDVELMGEELLDGYVIRDLCVIDIKVEVLFHIPKSTRGVSYYTIVPCYSYMKPF